MTRKWDFLESTAPQLTEQWFQDRAGRATGSNARHIVAMVRSGEAAARRDYRVQLCVERLTNKPQVNDFTNADMQRGIDLEAPARDALEAKQGYLVRQTGFLACKNELVGCSLDGEIGSFEGICEIKCPKSATHLRYMADGVMPHEHMPQILHNLLVSGAKWCDFASFDDRFPKNMQLWVIRVQPRHEDLVRYEIELEQFLRETAVELERLKKYATQ
jgi:hypothetical protein